MNEQICGLHHITAIAGNAQTNYDFYTRILGLRLVKKTVNFDDPTTYHFYYGNETGEPGTLLTFFPWEGIGRGRTGAGMATEIAYTATEQSLEFWQQRLRNNQVACSDIKEVFGRQTLRFTDPDGLQLSLVVPETPDNRSSWPGGGIEAGMGLKGFYSATLTLKELIPTAEILTGLFGYRQVMQDGNRYRFRTDTVAAAAVIDIIADKKATTGIGGAGTNHHIAFRVENEAVQMAFRAKIENAGFHITPKIDRDYFYSLYFREPGGVLFEIATDNPGFTVDEPLEELGSHLKLPRQHEPARGEIEKILPKLT